MNRTDWQALRKESREAMSTKQVFAPLVLIGYRETILSNGTAETALVVGTPGYDAYETGKQMAKKDLASVDYDNRWNQFTAMFKAKIYISVIIANTRKKAVRKVLEECAIDTARICRIALSSVQVKNQCVEVTCSKGNVVQLALNAKPVKDVHDFA